MKKRLPAILVAALVAAYVVAAGVIVLGGGKKPATASRFDPSQPFEFLDALDGRRLRYLDQPGGPFYDLIPTNNRPDIFDEVAAADARRIDAERRVSYIPETAPAAVNNYPPTSYVERRNRLREVHAAEDLADAMRRQADAAEDMASTMRRQQINDAFKPLPIRPYTPTRDYYREWLEEDALRKFNREMDQRQIDRFFRR